MKAKHESTKDHVPNGLLTLVVAAILLASIVPIASAGWDCRKPVTINNPGDALSDYQVLVTLNSSNFDYSKASLDGSDIGFVDGDNTVALNYWIEEWNIIGDSRIWVAVPSVDGSESIIIYMYYGNPGASDASDGDATFEFFDDFEDSTFNRWDHSTGWDISTDAYQGKFSAFAAGAPHHLTKSMNMSKGTFEGDFKFREINQYHYPYIPPFDSGCDGGGFPYLLSAKPDGRFGYMPCSGAYQNLPVDTPYIANQWYHIRVDFDFSVLRYWVYIDGELKTPSGLSLLVGTKITHLGHVNTNSNGVGGMGVGGMHVDASRVRKYAPIEPTTTVGAEESDPPKPPIPTYILETDTDDDGVPDVWDMDNSTPTGYWTDPQGNGRMWGDMNGDGKLTSVDALMILQAAAEAISL